MGEIIFVNGTKWICDERAPYDTTFISADFTEPFYMDTQPKHSPTGASSMYRWEACPGSVALCATLPPAPSSVYAEEGTKAHEIAATILRDERSLLCVDKEMIEAVNTYVNVCNGYFTPEHQKLGAQRWIEQHLDASASIPGMYGTVDCLIYWPWLKKLIVIDFKYGSGVYVGAKENTQLLYYAVAARLALSLVVDSVEVVIVQPRLTSGDDEGIRRWEGGADELNLFNHRLVGAIERTREPNAPLSAGDHCRFCPAAAVCPKLNEARDLALLSDFRKPLAPPSAPDTVSPYTPETIKKALDSLDALKAYIKAVDELAYRELEAGRAIPGYKLVAKRPTRKINDADRVIQILTSNGYTAEEIKTTPELKSPAQLEKTIQKQHKPLLEPYIVSESSGHVVVPESDPRPAIEGRNATADFLSLRALGVED